MNCREITPDYLAEIRQADTHPDGIANRIGVTIWEMAAMPSDEYLATVWRYAVGVTHQQILKYEHGAVRIGASRPYEISQLLDVPVSFFFEDMAAAIAGKPVPRTFDNDTYGSPEITGLIRAYYSIPDPDVRLRFRAVAKMIARGRHARRRSTLAR